MFYNTDLNFKERFSPYSPIINIKQTKTIYSKNNYVDASTNYDITKKKYRFHFFFNFMNQLFLKDKMLLELSKH